jgi:glycosyltransferase involved in cell wall biosynthesis
MSQSDVNATLARAAVGLCLSEVEGAMFSSIEYLVAGLPIVTVPNRGGRDYFFDADYCITAEPNPRAVREAVEALRDRGVPRDHVRARTLARLKPERDRFLAFLDELRAQRGIRGRHEQEPWPYSAGNIRRWGSVEEHARSLLPLGVP